MGLETNLGRESLTVPRSHLAFPAILGTRGLRKSEAEEQRFTVVAEEPCSKLGSVYNLAVMGIVSRSFLVPEGNYAAIGSLCARYQGTGSLFGQVFAAEVVDDVHI